MKDKGRKILKRTKLIKESKESKHNVSKQAHTEISEKITVGQSLKRDIRNMNDEEKRAYQRERKKKCRQNLKKTKIKVKHPRWFQLKSAKERYKSKKYNIGVAKYRKELDEAGKVQLFVRTYKKDDLKINGQFLEVEGVLPLRRFELQDIEGKYQDYTQLIDLLASLGYQVTISSADTN